MNGGGFPYYSNKKSIYGGSGGGGGGVEDSILDVETLPTSNIKENLFYRTNNADKYFIYNNQKYQDGSVVCYKCDGTYAYASDTQLNIELTPGNVDSYSWDIVDDTLINDLLNQEISGVHPIEIVSFDDCQTTVDYFIKYDTNKYDSALNFTKQTDYISQLQYYKNNEWHIVDNLQIDSIKLTPTTTRADLNLIGEEDIIKNSDFTTPKTDGIDWVLDGGQASNPDIINDDAAYKYANNKTSSNNYINTRLETIERKADAKTITKFVDTMPSNPDINTEYYVSAGTNNYNRYFVDSLGNVRSLGSTQMDVSTLATKQEVNLKQDISNLTTTLDANSTNTQYPSAKAVYDGFAPLQYYQLTQSSINADNCVFDINLTGAPSKNCISRKVYQNVVMTNPVTNASAYGSMEVIEECSAEWSTITQIFTAFHSGSNIRGSSMVFKRIGTLQDDAQDRQIYTNRANIVWKAWFVIEYPRTTLKALPDNTQITLNSSTFSITGGLLTINIRDLKSNVDVSRVSGVTFSKIPNLPREEASTFGTLYSFNNNTTETGGLQFQYDYVQAFGLKANVRYIGILTVPLGY